MHYMSTRGAGGSRNFGDIVFSGLAPDGGLFLPEDYPALSFQNPGPIRAIAGEVFKVYAPGFDPDWDHVFQEFPENPAPLRQLDDNLYLLELFHGPSASFKDFGLQVLGALFERGPAITVVGATSGDTGAAAVHALKNKKNVRLFMLHPKGRISELQRRQMTTVKADNIFNLAVDGTFDDCQTMLKETLSQGPYTAVNSINWGRILAQSIYYHWAAAEVKGPVHFIVPSGNFGNAFAGYVARQSGAAISGITIATNANDILARTFKTGTYKPGKAKATLSPAMDIQVASNFERLLFEVSGRDPDLVKNAAQDLKTKGFYDIPDGSFGRMTGFFDALSASDAATKDAIKGAFQRYKVVLDPHTAVAFAVYLQKRAQKGPVILLGTAHPAKFPESVPHAFLNTISLPAGLASLKQAPEFYDTIPNREGVLEKFIKDKTHDG